MVNQVSCNLRCECGAYITVYIPYNLQVGGYFIQKVLHVQNNRHDITVTRRPHDS